MSHVGILTCKAQTTCNRIVTKQTENMIFTGARTVLQYTEDFVVAKEKN